MAADKPDGLNSVDTPPASSPELSTPLLVVIATLAVIVVICLIAYVGKNSSRTPGSFWTFGSGENAQTSTSVAAPQSTRAFVRYSDPDQKRLDDLNAAKAAQRARLAASLASAHGGDDADAAAKKAAAAKATAQQAAESQSAPAASQSASQASTPASIGTQFSPVGTWVKQDGSGIYLAFHADGSMYEGYGPQTDNAPASAPVASNWLLQTDGTTTVISTSDNRFVVLGADTMQGEGGSTYIRVGE